MLFYKQSIGQKGEREAAKFLKKKGYKIVCKNYKNYVGEIDIIAQDKNYLVFVEVKTRTSTNFGLASQAVDYKKQQKIIKIAQMYVGKAYPIYMRFDIVEVYMDKTTKKIIKIRHLENAFGG